MVGQPTTYGNCIQCGQAIDASANDATQLDVSPPRFAHSKCVENKIVDLGDSNFHVGIRVGITNPKRAKRFAEKAIADRKPAPRVSNEEFLAQMDESPANRFLMMVMLNAIKQEVERIHFECFPSTDGESGTISVSHEKDGSCDEVHTPPFEQWPKLVRRLKIIAKAVDYGPNKSVEVPFKIYMSKSRSVDFLMTTNPDPHTDTKVTLEIHDKQSLAHQTARPSQDSV